MRRSGVPEAFEEHIKLMFDLQVLAYQAEITRISTLMLRARERATPVYPRQRRARRLPQRVAPLERPRATWTGSRVINRYHVQMLAYFLEKLKATPDGDGTLLDHSMVLYGSSMSNGNQHNHDPLPVVLAGGASGQLEGRTPRAVTRRTRRCRTCCWRCSTSSASHQAQLGDSTGLLDV